MPFSRLLPLPDLAQASSDRRHAERDAQIAAVEARLAGDPAARERMERLARNLHRQDSHRLNAEANHDYVEGFDERWDDPHASIKRGP